MKNFWMLPVFVARVWVCGLFLIFALFAETAFTQDYCQYCFSFTQNDGQRKFYISNVFSYPTTQNPGNGFYCYVNYQQAKDKRSAEYSRFVGAKYAPNEVLQKDYCDAVGERAAAEQNQRMREQELEAERLNNLRQLEEERLWYLAEQERKQKAEEQNKSDRIRRKEDIQRYYQSLSPKPKSISDGWHLVTLITKNDEVIEQQKVRVESNRVTQKAETYLPLYDSIRTVSSGPIETGKIIIESRGEFYDAYFFDYIKNAEAKATPPERDTRSLWWHTQAHDAWKEVLDGRNGNAYVSTSTPLRFTKISKQSLDAIEQVTRLEIRAVWLHLYTPASIYNLRRSPFKNLSNAALSIKGDNYNINLSSIDEFEKMREQVEIFCTVFNDHWRKMITGGLSAPHGAYIGDKRIMIDRSNLTPGDFAIMAKITKLWLNSADAVRNEKIHNPNKNSRGRDGGDRFRVTGQAIKLDKRINSLLESVQILSFDNTDLTIDDLADYEMPPFAKVQTLQACNTPAAKKWGGMSGKKRQALSDAVKRSLKGMQGMNFCRD